MQLRDDLHPYARAIRDAWLARLDDLPRPWVKGAAWDSNCFVTARKLIELANSPWSGYDLTTARSEYESHAPRDAVWDKSGKCWDQAMLKAAAVALPEPEPGQVIPDVTTLHLDSQVAADSNLPPLLNPIIDWHDLFASDDDGEEWIIEPLLPARRMVALYSAPKAGKSLLMLELAVGMARGTEVIGTKPEPVRVLYVDFENDPRGDIRARLEAMDVGPGDLDNLCYLTYPSLPKLDTAQGAYDLMRHVEHYDCQVVVIDTVSRAVGGEENENDTWLSFYRHTGLSLKQAGVACIRLDHSGKDREKGMRGGSAKYGDVDAVWRLEAVSDDTIRLDCTDNRMPVPVKTIALTRQSYPLRHVLEGQAWTVVEDAKTRAVDERLDALGVPASASVREASRALREAGEKVENRAIREAVKARKLRLDVSVMGVPGTPPAHPGTPGVSVPGTGPPKGGRAAHPSGTSGTPAAHPSEKEAPEGPVLVSCKRCFRPVERAVADKHDGHCVKCQRELGVDQ